MPLTVVLANAEDMHQVLASGRVSDTPGAPVWLKARLGMPGMWELADGHHRVADLQRRGIGEVDAELDPVEDDEPLKGPFFDFGAALRSRRYAVAIQPGRAYASITTHRSGPEASRRRAANMASTAQQARPRSAR